MQKNTFKEENLKKNLKMCYGNPNLEICSKKEIQNTKSENAFQEKNFKIKKYVPEI